MPRPKSRRTQEMDLNARRELLRLSPLPEVFAIIGKPDIKTPQTQKLPPGLREKVVYIGKKPHVPTVEALDFVQAQLDARPSVRRQTAANKSTAE